MHHYQRTLYILVLKGLKLDHINLSVNSIAKYHPLTGPSPPYSQKTALYMEYLKKLRFNYLKSKAQEHRYLLCFFQILGEVFHLQVSSYWCLLLLYYFSAKVICILNAQKNCKIFTRKWSILINLKNCGYKCEAFLGSEILHLFLVH